MAQFTETEVIGASTLRQALLETLERIRERGQSQFKNHLKVKHGGGFFSIVLPYFYIAEVQKTYWLGIIPRKQLRRVFSIHDDFSDGQKTIRCAVFDRSLIDIVKEELEKYTDVFQMTHVEIHKEFAQ